MIGLCIGRSEVGRVPKRTRNDIGATSTQVEGNQGRLSNIAFLPNSRGNFSLLSELTVEDKQTRSKRRLTARHLEATVNEELLKAWKKQGLGLIQQGHGLTQHVKKGLKTRPIPKL